MCCGPNDLAHDNVDDGESSYGSNDSSHGGMLSKFQRDHCFIFFCPYRQGAMNSFGDVNTLRFLTIVFSLRISKRNKKGLIVECNDLCEITININKMIWLVEKLQTTQHYDVKQGRKPISHGVTYINMVAYNSRPSFSFHKLQWVVIGVPPLSSHDRVAACQGKRDLRIRIICLGTSLALNLCFYTLIGSLST